MKGEQYDAWVQVQDAVLTGRLAKPNDCEQCKQKPPRDFHHSEGYDNPLIGRWLCRSCHRKEEELDKRIKLAAFLRTRGGD